MTKKVAEQTLQQAANMVKHTSEPWKVADRDLSHLLCCSWAVYTEDTEGWKTVIADVWRTDTDDARNEEDMGKHNAHRICACVNACAGIANPQAIPELVNAVRNELSGDTDHPRALYEAYHNLFKSNEETKQ